MARTKRHADADALRLLLARHLAYGDNILVVGPGASALHERLYDGCMGGAARGIASRGVSAS
jgi:hypothetical protein